MENTNLLAGSATGIDLNRMEAYANESKAGDLHAAEALMGMLTEDTVLAMIALARATPQHPDLDAAQLEPLLQNWFGLEDCKGLFNPARLLAFANAARRATPQHSVTEQASIDTPEFRERLADLIDAYRDELNGGPEQPYEKARAVLIAYIDTRARPLASTAATQPEQASDRALFETWFVAALRKTYPHMPESGVQRMLSKHEDGTYTDLTTQHDWSVWQASVARAALAIPASTAPRIEVAYDGKDQSGTFTHVLQPKAVSRNPDGSYVAFIDLPLSTAASEQAKVCARCEDGMIYVEEAFQPCPDCQDLSDYNDDDTATIAASEQQASVSEARTAFDARHFGYEFPSAALRSGAYEEFAAGYRAALSDRATIPSEADERAVGEIVANDPVHGWHMNPLVPWNQIGTGTKLYTRRATTATPGYKLVPIEPTDDMCRAAREKMGVGANYADHIYRAMLVATPAIATTAADQQGYTAEPVLQVWSKEAEMTESWLAAQAQQGAKQEASGGDT